MTTSMQEASDLYEVAGNAQLYRVCVDDGRFQTFSVAVRRLQSDLGDDTNDSYWRPVLARLRRLRWELATVPLPFTHPTFALTESVGFIDDRLRYCERVWPLHARLAREVVAHLAELCHHEANPLGTAVREVPSPGPARVLVLREGRHASAVEQSLGVHLGMSVVTPAQLVGTRVYDGAAVIGPACWFPRQVFAAPRAREIHVIQFGWLSDPTPLEARIFTGSTMESGPGPYFLPAYGGRPEQGAGVASAELIPVTDWAAIASGTGASRAEDEERPDTVDAYLLLLASEQAVYLEAEEGSRAYVVELGTSKELHMVATRSIQPGTYIVNRVGGEGDYIPAIADTLLAAEAPRLRAVQRRWKELLQDVVRSAGITAVLSRLAEAGSPRATRGNLRRWASAVSIRTEDHADFAALMKVIGLEAETDELWRAMDVIDQAHLRAGQRVRGLLVREILKGDTRELEDRGWQDYDVEEIKGEGALRVARVEARAPTTMRVGVRQTRQLFPVERDLWQG